MTNEAKSYEELQALAEAYLRERRLGVLATGRNAGTPQQSIVSYSFVGDEIAIRSGSSTAKVVNIGRRSGVSLAVVDGPTCVVVYGDARLLEGDEAEAFIGEPLSSGRQRGTPTLIVFAPHTYRWARLEG